jgi:hypothetical protein
MGCRQKHSIVGSRKKFSSLFLALSIAPCIALAITVSSFRAWALDPQAVGRWPGFNRDAVLDICLSGNRAYLAAEQAGLIIMDVTDPSHRVRLGSIDTGGSTARVLLRETTAFVTDGNEGLQMFDVGDAQNGRRLGALRMAHASALALAGEMAAVTTGTNGLALIDISNVREPKLLGSIGLTNSTGDVVGAYDVSLSGDYALVACDFFGLRIVDIRNPAEPVLVASLPALTASRIVVQGNRAFMVGYFLKALKVLDISDPLNIRELGQYKVPGGASALAVSGSRAFIGHAPEGTTIVDFSDPTHLVRIGTNVPTANAQALTVANEIIYSGDYYGSFAWDLSNPAKPQFLGADEAQIGNAFNVAINGDIAYLADFFGGFQIIDIHDSSNPVRLANMDFPGYEWDVKVTNKIAYIAAGQTGLAIVDVADPAQPKTIGQYGQLTNVFKALTVTVRDNTAFVGDFNQLVIIDVNTPASPKKLAAFPTSGLVLSVALEDNLAFVAGDQGFMRVLDIANLKAPKTIGTYPVSFPIKVAARGNVVYLISADSGLHIIDISNPANPVKIATYPFTRIRSGYMGAFGTGSLELHENLLFTSDDSGKLLIFDISEPLKSFKVGEFDTRGFVYGVTAVGTRLFIGNSYGGLAIFDLSNLATPALRVGRDGTGVSLQLSGYPFRTYQLDAAEILSSANSWHSIAQFTLTNNPQLLPNPNPTESAAKFYRASLLETGPLNQPPSD